MNVRGGVRKDEDNSEEVSVKVKTDFFAASVDWLDVPGIEKEVSILQSAIEAGVLLFFFPSLLSYLAFFYSFLFLPLLSSLSGTHSMDMMKQMPAAVGTLFMRFLDQLPEKLLSQQLTSKFLWVQGIASLY